MATQNITAFGVEPGGGMAAAGESSEPVTRRILTVMQVLATAAVRSTSAAER
jgi:hypothetical protein